MSILPLLSQGLYVLQLIYMIHVSYYFLIVMLLIISEIIHILISIFLIRPNFLFVYFLFLYSFIPRVIFVKILLWFIFFILLSNLLDSYLICIILECLYYIWIPLIIIINTVFLLDHEKISIDSYITNNIR